MELSGRRAAVAIGWLAAFLLIGGAVTSVDAAPNSAFLRVAGDRVVEIGRTAGPWISDALTSESSDGGGNAGSPLARLTSVDGLRSLIGLPADPGDPLTSAPTLLAVEPGTIADGGRFFTVTITLNQQFCPTAFINGTQLQAVGPATLISTTGSAAVTVVNPAPGGGVATALPFTITAATAPNPLPTIGGLDPQTAATGADFALTIAGTHFLPGSIALWDGATLVTTYVSPTLLTATVPARQAGGYSGVAVVNPTPGGGLSNARPVTVTEPAPVIDTYLTLFNPLAGPPSVGNQVIAIGSGFTPRSIVLWNGQPLPTRFDTPTALYAPLPDYLAGGGEVAAVAVVNPLPGGGLSPSIPVTVSNQAPYFASGQAQNATFDGFGNQHLIWDGGSVTITAWSPPPGGGTSSAQATVTITNSVPLITALDPPGRPAAGSGDFTLTVTGSRLLRGAVVSWAGTPLPTTFVNAGQLTATVPSSLLDRVRHGHDHGG